MMLFTGMEYLAIDIANNYGLDHLNWTDRIDWFNSNKEDLDALVSTAKHPAKFMAGVQAYHKASAGQAIGYPISLDATASGTQILAVMSQDLISAERCNVVNTGNREDAYDGFYKYLLSMHPSIGSIDRKEVKKATMTALYSSKAQPKRVFGDAVSVFWEGIGKFFPGAWGLNQAMSMLQDPKRETFSWILPDNFHVRFAVKDTVPESFVFAGESYDVFTRKVMPTEHDRSISANVVHSVDGYVAREMQARCNYDLDKIQYLKRLLFKQWKHPGDVFDTPDNLAVVELWETYEKCGVLSSRILDHLNGANLFLVDRGVINDLIASLPAKPFKVLSVHDCFQCLPSYGNDIRKQYNIILSSLADSKITGFILNQIAGSQFVTSTPDPVMASKILEADYSLS